MPVRHFTVEEANDLLPELEPLMAEVLERRARVVTARKELGPAFEDLHNDFGGSVASSLVKDFMAIERLARKIQSYGCVVKDLNAGLLDFLSEREGREIYLCWRYGEPQVAFYHELHTGYNGRQPV